MAKSLEKFFISRVKTLPDEEYVIESENVVKSATVKPKLPKPVTTPTATPSPSGLALQVMIDLPCIARLAESHNITQQISRLA